MKQIKAGHTQTHLFSGVLNMLPGEQAAHKRPGDEPGMLTSTLRGFTEANTENMQSCISKLFFGLGRLPVFDLK